jgi:beta-glucosidase
MGAAEFFGLGDMSVYVVHSLGICRISGKSYGAVAKRVGFDPERVAYLASHVEALGRALDAGAPVTAYFAWSLLDNFEWARGHTKRFGLFRTDYSTLERSWKDSARWYQRLAQTNRVPS